MDKIIDPAFLNSPWLRDGQHFQHDCEAPLWPRREQESALSWLGFQEGTATSGLLPHQVLLYPSGCPKCSWGCCTGTIKGPSSWALGWAEEGLSLSIFVWGKNWPPRCSFPHFSLFALLDCSVLREAKKVNQLQWFQQPFKHTGGSNAGFRMPGLFQHYSTSWTAEKGNSN